METRIKTEKMKNGGNMQGVRYGKFWIMMLTLYVVLKLEESAQKHVKQEESFKT